MLGNRGKLHPGTWGSFRWFSICQTLSVICVWVFETQTLWGHLLEKQTEPLVGASSSLEQLTGCFLLEISEKVNTLRTDIPEQQALSDITGAGAAGGFWQTLLSFGPVCPVLVHISAQRTPIFPFPSWRYNKDPGLTKHSCKQHKTTLLKRKKK